ncbi:MAG: TorF family putative porin [Mangrovibacterium sp.]
MKKMLLTFTTGLILISAMHVQAQESSWTAGMDIVSNYIWRGTKLGTGPALQPSIKFNTGGLTVGVWGSFDANGYAEADPYFSYAFSNGLSIGITDYFLPNSEGSKLFDENSNAYEVNAGYATGGLSLSANYILNEAPVPASAGDDLYFQAGYAFENFSLSVGAGDGWHTSDGDFNVCHVGIGTTREIKISESFSLPVFGQVILNPEKEQLYVVVGLSL